MLNAKIDKNRILEELKKTNYEDLKESLKDLKEGFDWNPFDADEDEYKTAWEEFQNNINLIIDVFQKVIFTVEKIGITTLGVLEGGGKLEAAAEFIDSVVKFPFWIDAFDRPIIRMLISMLVNQINAKYGHSWDDAGLLKDI